MLSSDTLESSKSVIVRVGDRAPDFCLKTDQGQDWRLADYSGRVVVLLFYPGDETIVCTRQLCSIRDNWASYLATKAVIVGISPGTPGGHHAFSQRRHLPISLLADPNRNITRTYSQHWLLPVNFMRAVVVIDAGGIIRTSQTMMRIFRPSDERLLTDIYKARGDALGDEYTQIQRRIQRIGHR